MKRYPLPLLGSLSSQVIKPLFMNKILYFLVAAILYNSPGLSQETRKDTKPPETKMEVFASRTGTIVKIIDTYLPSLKLYLGGVAETRIRKIFSGNEARYFYQVEKEGKYSSNTASIEQSDLLEIIKALKLLKSEAEKDMASDPHYLENKFSTVDGFQIGYYVSKRKAQWFLKLEKYGSDNTVFVNDVDDLEASFSNAKETIDGLKK